MRLAYLVHESATSACIQLSAYLIELHAKGDTVCMIIAKSEITPHKADFLLDLAYPDQN